MLMARRHEIGATSMWSESELELLHHVVAGVRYEKPHHLRQPQLTRRRTALQDTNRGGGSGDHTWGLRRDSPPPSSPPHWSPSVPHLTNQIRPRRRPKARRSGTAYFWRLPCQRVTRSNWELSELTGGQTGKRAWFGWLGEMPRNGLLQIDTSSCGQPSSEAWNLLLLYTDWTVNWKYV